MSFKAGLVPLADWRETHDCCSRSETEKKRSKCILRYFTKMICSCCCLRISHVRMLYMCFKQYTMCNLDILICIVLGRGLSRKLFQLWKYIQCHTLLKITHIWNVLDNMHSKEQTLTSCQHKHCFTQLHYAQECKSTVRMAGLHISVSFHWAENKSKATEGCQAQFPHTKMWADENAPTPRRKTRACQQSLCVIGPMTTRLQGKCIDSRKCTRLGYFAQLAVSAAVS